MPRVGDRVKILRKDIAGLYHRRNRNGRVTHIDGSYILVRPMWCHWETELYPGEVKVL
jgi:hypothetical protein